MTGGKDKYECSARDWDNFLRVDDQDNVIVPKVVSNDIVVPVEESGINPPLDYKGKLSMLKDMVKHLDELPQHLMEAPINHYDFYSFVAVIISLLEQVDPRPSSQPLSQDQPEPSD